MAPNSNAVMIVRFSIQYSTIALLWYDYALTWTREVQYFWTKRFTLSTALYVLCRYGLVANILYTLALAGKLPTMSCDAGYRICAILSVLGRIGIVTVWGARAYAVFNRSKIILVVYGVLQLIVLGLAALHVPYVSCTTLKDKEPVPALLTVFTFIYEITSAVLTSVRSVQALKGGGPLKAQRKSLTFLVFREGLIYYGFITALGLLAMIVQFRGEPGSYFFPRLMNAYNLPLSGLMTARFLLHLREWDHRMTNRETDQWGTHGRGSNHNAAIRFRRFEHHTTHWTINDVLGDDPLLKPVVSEIDISSSGASASRVGQ